MTRPKKLPEDVVPEYDTDNDEPLTPDAQRKAFEITARNARMMNRIASGGIVNGRAPGTREICQMLALKAAFSQAKPARDAGTRAPTFLQVIDPYATPDAPDATIAFEVREPVPTEGEE